MDARLLVMSAGSGAGGNLVRSIRAGNASVTIVGCHDDQFILKNSAADRNYLARPSAPGLGRALRRIVDTERSTSSSRPATGRRRALARARRAGRPSLPSAGRHGRALRRQVPAHRVAAGAGGARARTHRVTDLRHLERIFERLGNPARAWCRIRAGAGSRGRGAGRGAGAGAELDRLLARHARRAGLRVHPVRVPARSRFRLPERVEGRPPGAREDLRAAVLPRQREPAERGVRGGRAHQDRPRAGRARDRGAGDPGGGPQGLRGVRGGPEGRRERGRRASPRSTRAASPPAPTCST